MEDKKERQLENLTHLVERHTRTERHLEQYSDIGNPEYKERAREKQEVREEEMNNLKEDILGHKDNQTVEEQLENIEENYKSAEGYIENNMENLSDEQLENMFKRQENRKQQKDNLE